MSECCNVQERYQCPELEHHKKTHGKGTTSSKCVPACSDAEKQIAAESAHQLLIHTAPQIAADRSHAVDGGLYVEGPGTARTRESGEGCRERDEGAGARRSR